MVRKFLERLNLEIQLYDVGDYEPHDDLHGLAGIPHWWVEQAVVRGQEHLGGKYNCYLELMAQTVTKRKVPNHRKK